MMQHLANMTAAGTAFASFATGTFVVLMALLIGNAARLTRRRTCRIRVRPRGTQES